MTPKHDRDAQQSFALNEARATDRGTNVLHAQSTAFPFIHPSHSCTIIIACRYFTSAGPIYPTAQ